MNKIYYLWLEVLRENNIQINYEYIKNNISYSNIMALFNGESNCKDKLDISILNSFLDKNIKERTINLLIYIIKLRRII